MRGVKEDQMSVSSSEKNLSKSSMPRKPSKKKMLLNERLKKLRTYKGKNPFDESIADVVCDLFQHRKIVQFRTAEKLLTPNQEDDK